MIDLSKTFADRWDTEVSAEDPEIFDKLKAAMELILECEKIAIEKDQLFSFRLVYGAGATFWPNGLDGTKTDVGWNPSNTGC
jgi:hypothetical protein